MTVADGNRISADGGTKEGLSPAVSGLSSVGERWSSVGNRGLRRGVASKGLPTIAGQRRPGRPSALDQRLTKPDG